MVNLVLIQFFMIASLTNVMFDIIITNDDLQNINKPIIFIYCSDC